MLCPTSRDSSLNGSSMRLYYEVALRSFRRATTYRVAFLAGIITNAFFGAIMSFVYIAVYAARGDAVVAGYSLRDAISYIWVGQALIAVGAAWLFSDLKNAIRSGDVAVDLMRPWNFYAYWFSQQFGSRLFNLLTRGVFTYLIGVLYFNARIPDLPNLLPFTLAIILSIIISCAFNFLVNASAFWMLDNNGVMTIASIIMMFFSGFMIPLSFMPAWLESLARLLPFQAITGLPIEILLGLRHGDQLWSALGLQLVWALTLTLAALAQMRAAMHKIVIQGG